MREFSESVSPLLINLSCAMLAWQEQEFALLMYGNYVVDKPSNGIFATEDQNG